MATSTRRGPDNLGSVYGEWLDTFQWTWFLTLTFRLPPSSRTSLGHFRRLTRWLDSTTRGFSCGWFVGSETGPQGGREHLHGLIFIPPLPDVDGGTPLVDSLRTATWKWWYGNGPWKGKGRKPRWWREGYGRATISVIKDHEKASHYVSKYCTKTLAEWDIGGNCVGIEKEVSGSRVQGE